MLGRQRFFQTLTGASHDRPCRLCRFRLRAREGILREGARAARLHAGHGNGWSRASIRPSGHPAAGFGRDGKPDFWIGGEGRLEKPLHVAIVADSRAAVDAFHREALAAGARDNGAPGLRPHYHANYYAAFVLDADGHNIEAVCHKPE